MAGPEIRRKPAPRPRPRPASPGPQVQGPTYRIRLKWIAIVLATISVMALLPIATGFLAETRVRALVTRLNEAVEGQGEVKLLGYERGLYASRVRLEVTFYLPTENERYEVPFTVGHGPVPWGDIFAGRSAFRVCAGFLAFDTGRGRGPRGVLLAPLRGRVVLGLFGGIDGELAMRADDIRPLTTTGVAEDASLTLEGDGSALTVEAFLPTWNDPSSDKPAFEIGGASVTLRVAEGTQDRTFGVARLVFRQGEERRTLEGFELRMTDSPDRSSFVARASLLKRETEERTDLARGFSLTYASDANAGARAGSIAFALGSYTGPDGGLREIAIRATAQMAAPRVASLARSVLRAFGPPPPPPAPRAPPLARFDLESLVPALAAGLADPRIDAIEAAFAGFLASGPELSMDVSFADEARRPLLRGTVKLGAEAARVRSTATISENLFESLVLTLSIDVTRDVGLRIARNEIEHRARHLMAAEDPERRALLVQELWDAALAARVVVPRGDLFHLDAVVPLGARGETTFGGRDLGAFSAQPLGIVLRRAEMPRTQVALGTVVASGDVTDGQVIVALAAHARDLRLCAEGELLDAPTVLEGDVPMEMIIAPTGAVTSAVALSNGVNDESVVACFGRVLGGLVLPPTRRGARATVPIHVSRGAAAAAIP